MPVPLPLEALLGRLAVKPALEDGVAPPRQLPVDRQRLVARLHAHLALLRPVAQVVTQPVRCTREVAFAVLLLLLRRQHVVGRGADGAEPADAEQLAPQSVALLGVEVFLLIEDHIHLVVVEGDEAVGQPRRALGQVGLQGQKELASVLLGVRRHQQRRPDGVDVADAAGDPRHRLDVDALVQVLDEQDGDLAAGRQVGQRPQQGAQLAVLVVIDPRAADVRPGGVDDHQPDLGLLFELLFERVAVEQVEQLDLAARPLDPFELVATLQVGAGRPEARDDGVLGVVLGADEQDIHRLKRGIVQAESRLAPGQPGGQVQ